MPSILKVALNFSERMKLVKEYDQLSEKMNHLKKRFNIDKISDPSEAQEIKIELNLIQTQIDDILEKLTFK